MRFYPKPHKFYGGSDLHARTLAVCRLDQAGAILLPQNMTASPEAFLRTMAPARHDLVVAGECLFP